eukprot:TRINITY_DN23203_c0_g1_i1.p1 TRINITY_DN23203_c0_g1~~TRINITY_DN23203_c0_g1_i1.p1  ORF type:complete len:220 (+),score=45.95 TRINITY_DN23203_c0_g1_i1:31-690(+)
MDVFAVAYAKQHIPFDVDTMGDDQKTCMVLMAREKDKISQIPDRWLILQEVIVMVTGYGTGDEEEAIADEAFSSVEFFTAFNGIVDKAQQLDYLLCCIAKAVCVIHRGYEKHFMSAIKGLFKPKPQPRYTPTPYKYNCCTEQQLAMYQSRDSTMWPTWKTRLQELEDEQLAFEHKHRKKIFNNWDKSAAELNADQEATAGEGATENAIAPAPAEPPQQD